jgi:hypothetical protein
MKNNIVLDIDHPEKKRVEYFLSGVEQPLEQIPFDARELSHVDDVTAGFKFKGARPSTFVIVIFATSYFHANEISKSNLLTRPAIKWTINGEILFGVESPDEDACSEMLSGFAGRE